jgi:hypothetical protein
LDFSRLLQLYLPNVWDSILSGTASPQLDTMELKVFNKLQGTTLEASGKTDLKNSLENDESTNLSFTTLQRAVLDKLVDALVEISGGNPPDPTQVNSIADALENSTAIYDRKTDATRYPQFLFPLADLLYSGPLPYLAGDALAATGFEPDDSKEYVELLRQAVKAALKEQAGSVTVTPPQPLGSQPVMDTTEGWFVLRCMMERPECDPELSPPIVSEPSEPFRMAGFFDPDAPARPIRIQLPVDTTPAGLRKFDKNAAFVLSDVLCGQVARAKGMSLGDLVRAVLPWPLHKDLSLSGTGKCSKGGADIGMICTLSIPIVTICALILLIIIVNLLDMVFHWLPYFIVCFPLPKFSAKGQS